MPGTLAVLNGIDKRLRVFHPYADGQRLGFDGDTACIEFSIDIPSRVAHGQNNCIDAYFSTVPESNAFNRITSIKRSETAALK